MRAALAVNRIGPDPAVNLARIISMVAMAADSRADLVVFPEAAVTGLINNDDPAHDLPLGQKIPGPVTFALSQHARKCGIWLGIGLLERDQNRLYDSAILLNPQGEIALKYRRNQPQWHGPRVDPAVYCQGSMIPKTTTPFGDVAILICGDLFDDPILEKTRMLRPDLLLFPFARNFPDLELWEKEEVPAYAQRAQMAGVPTLMVNYLGARGTDEEEVRGGAMVVSAKGEVIKRMPLNQEGLLLTDL